MGKTELHGYALPIRKQRSESRRREPRGSALLLSLKCLTLAIALFLAQPRARAQEYPPCNISNCSMTTNGGFPMVTTVNVYLIWYGEWSKTGADAAYQSLVPTLIEGLNDSAYSSVLRGYGATGIIKLGKQIWINGGGGLTDDPGSNVGPPYVSTVQSTISQAITSNSLPNDINGVYLLLTHNDVNPSWTNDGLNYAFYPPQFPWQIPGTPGYVCGYNDDRPLAGTHNIKFDVIPQNSQAINGCQWGFQTPNTIGGTDLTGKLDYYLSIVAHELFESITDPQEEAGKGWWSSSSPHQQISDLCQNQVGAEYATSSGAPANEFLNGHDFLIQPTRPNANNGYCANNSGGPIWPGTNFGFSWSPVGDWSPGNLKGECESGQPLAGISTYDGQIIPSGGPTHAVYCNSDFSKDSSKFAQSSSCHLVPFDGLDGVAGDNRGDSDDGWDWDPGYYKGECAANEFVAGVSQSTKGLMNGLLCCPGSVTHGGCITQFFNSTLGVDWDYGMAKAQCQSSGQYIAGVSVIPPGYNDSGTPNRILCCSDSFQPLTLENGWTNAPFSTAPAVVSNTSGIVQLAGAIATTGTNSEPFTIPAGFRPSSDVYVPVDLCSATNGRLHIQPSGVVDVEAETSFSDAQCFTSLEGVSFATSASGFTALTLENGWTDAPFSTRNAAVENDAGIIRFQGAIATSGTNQTAFTLPPGFRPSLNMFVPVDLCGATKGRLSITPNGSVSVEAEGGNFSNAQCFTSLEGATFPLASAVVPAAPIGIFRSLTLVNGWTNAPYGTRNAAVYNSDGVVRLEGAVSNGTSSLLFTLPVGTRPQTAVYVNVDLCGAVQGRLDIFPNGEVFVEEPGGAISDAECFISLEGVSFAD
jgi:hypothetical protein